MADWVLRAATPNQHDLGWVQVVVAGLVANSTQPEAVQGGWHGQQRTRKHAQSRNKARRLLQLAFKRQKLLASTTLRTAANEARNSCQTSGSPHTTTCEQVVVFGSRCGL